IGDAILAAPVAVDDLCRVRLAFGWRRCVGVDLSLSDQLGRVVLLGSGIADHAGGYQSVGTSAARPDQDDPDRELEQEPLALLLRPVFSFILAHQYSLIFRLGQ